jgi:hypothetical protein
MPTWPSGTKAGTTNVDNPNDLVIDARADIKQNIDNVNDIIDTFSITSPNDGDVLQYNSTAGTFSPVAGVGVGTAVVQFNSNLSSGSNLTYSGGFTVIGSSTDISAGYDDSAGYSQIFMPQGQYIVATITPIYAGSYGAIPSFSISTTWKRSNPDSSGIRNIWSFSTVSTDIYFRNYQGRTFITLDQDEYVWLEYSSNASQAHPALFIQKVS